MKFDKIMLLANGWVVYFNDAMKSAWYFQLMGYPVPNLMNPADHYLSITSIEALEDELLDQSTKLDHIPWDELELKYEHKINQMHKNYMDSELVSDIDNIDTSLKPISEQVDPSKYRANWCK